MKNFRLLFVAVAALTFSFTACQSTTEEVKEELIGGFIFSYEDKQYDASILKRIKNLRKEFKHNLYIKGF